MLHALPCARILLLLAMFCATPQAALPADDIRLVGKVTALFDVGWKPAPTAMSAAEALYDQARQLAPADGRVPYAMALVALQNRKHDEAVGWLEEVVSADARDLPARRALIWTHVLTKRIPEALANMRLLAKQISADRQPAVAAVEQEEHGAFLGRVMGYLAGPGSGTVAADRLSTCEREILTLLGPTGQIAYNGGRKQTLASFAQMETELAQSREQGKTEQAKERDLLEKKLHEDRMQLTAARADLEAKAKASKTRYDTEEAQVGPMLTQLRDQLSRLQARSQPLANELNSLSFEIGQTLAQANAETDRFIARRLFSQADRMRDRSRVVQAELRELEGAIGQVQQRGAGLENRLQGAANRYQTESKQFNAEAARLLKSEKALAVSDRTLAKPANGDTPKVNSLATRLRAFTTYEPLSPAEERDRILASFK